MGLWAHPQTVKITYVTSVDAPRRHSISGAVPFIASADQFFRKLFLDTFVEGHLVGQRAGRSPRPAVSVPPPRPAGRLRNASPTRRTPASVYGLEASPSVRKALVPPARTGILKRGGGRSVAECAAVTPVALRASSATAAGTLPMAVVPPYSSLETVQRMGTS